MAFNIEKKVTLLHSQEQETRAREAAHKQGLYYVDLKKVLIENNIQLVNLDKLN